MRGILSGLFVRPESSPRFIVLIFAFVLIGVALVLLGTSPFGVGYSADSVAYLSTAQSVSEGRGFLCWDCRPYVDWPPLYPVLLSGIYLVDVDPGVMIRWLNALLFGSLILLSAWTFRLHFESVFGISVFLASVAFSYLLLTMHAMVYSEPIFILLVLLSLAVLLRYLERGSWLLLTTLALISSLACLQRIAGVALVATAVLGVLLWSHETGFWKRVFHASVYAGLALVPLALWTLRNTAIQSTLAGNRTLTAASPFPFLLQIFDGMSSWILPRPFPLWIRVIMWGGIVLLVIVMNVRLARRNRGGEFVSVRAREVMLLWVVVYSSFMVVVSMFTTTRCEPLNIRLISPIYVPFMYLFVHAVERIGLARAIRKNPITIFMAIWLLYPMLISARQISKWQEHGVCPYRAERWMQSETLTWVHNHPELRPVFSDHPEAFYVRLGLRDVGLSPMEQDSKQDIMKRWGGSTTAALVWFEDMTWGRNLKMLDDLRHDFNIETIARLSDGTVYRMIPILRI